MTYGAYRLLEQMVFGFSPMSPPFETELEKRFMTVRVGGSLQITETGKKYLKKNTCPPFPKAKKTQEEKVFLDL